MRCLCYVKFLSSGAISPSKFFAQIGTKWSCSEDYTKSATNISNLGMLHNSLLPKSIVFIADCKSVKQLTLDPATLPGAGISCLEIFPVPEVLEYQ